MAQTAGHFRPKSSVFIAASVDGYIARADGNLDWLDRANRRVPAGEDCGYGAFIATIDTIVMGRSTFEKALSFDTWPYEGMPVIVLSRRGVTIPTALGAAVTASAGSPRVLVERLGQGGARSLYVDGGQTIQSFLRAGLIDEITITTIPVLLGGGRTLFGGLARAVELELLGTKRFEFGFLQYTYRVLHPSVD